MRVLAAVVVVFVAAAMVQATVSQNFSVVKDGGADRYSGNTVANGGAPHFRGAKATWREDLSFHAFNNAAISAFITANGGAANIQSATLYFAPQSWAGPAPDGTAGIQVRQLISGVDWAEGNGDWNNGTFSWDANTADASYLYAQTYWKMDANDNAVIDTDRSVPWSSANNTRQYDPQLGYVDGNSASGGLRDMLLNGPNYTGAEGLVNSAVWTPPAGAALDAYYPVALDKAFLLDTISNANCRGIMLYDANSVAWSNWEVWMREGGKGAYISLTMVPEPATMALLALGGLLIARRRRA